MYLDIPQGSPVVLIKTEQTDITVTTRTRVGKHIEFSFKFLAWINVRIKDRNIWRGK